MDGVGEKKAKSGRQRGDVRDLIAESAIGEVSYKELYEELVKSEERFRLLYENSPLGYQSLDSSGCLLEVNPAWLDLLGYDRDEVIGHSFADFVARKELFVERFPKFKKIGKSCDIDFQMVCKDGRLVDIEIDGKVAYNADGSFRQTHCILHDVTQRKRAEEKLHFLSLIAEQISDSVITTGLDYRITYTNKAFQELYGYDENELIGQSPDILNAEANNDKVQGDIYETVSGGEIWSGEILNRRKDGSEFVCETMIFPMVNESGEIFAYGSIQRDISERKRSEQEREDLLRVIESKNDEMQSIVYVASHDLKSPLVNITGFGEEMGSHCEELLEMMGKVTVCDEDSQRLGVLLNEYIPESLGYIHSATKKMRGLIDGLLQVSRVGTCEMVIRELDMNELIAGIVTSVGFEAKEAGVEIIVENLVDCVGDASRANQVFSNLINNAIKYMDPNRKGVVRVSARVEGGQSLYCIEDNGRGIDQKYQKRVFEIFHRLVPGDSVGGEGLGLTIVMRILDRLGGRVWVESESGKGSKFFVSLPNKQ